MQTLYVYSENSDGEIERINFSQPQRDSHFNVSLENAILWYKAIHHFVHMLHSTEFKVSFKMKEGKYTFFVTHTFNIMLNCNSIILWLFLNYSLHNCACEINRMLVLLTI